MFTSSKLKLVIFSSFLMSHVVLAQPSDISTTVNLPTVTFNQNDLQLYGESNVYSLLNYVPGFQTVLSENQSTHADVQIRGVSAQAGYIVLMVDGIKINNVLFSDVALTNPIVDLSMADSVEVYTGSNSVKFGDNAVLAVINIVTKKANQLAFESGEYNHEKSIASLYRATSFGSFSFNVMSSNGDGGKFMSANIPVSQYITNKQYMNRPYQHEQISLTWEVESMDVGNLGVRYYWDKNQQEGFLNTNFYHQDNQFESQNHYVTAFYNNQINENVSFSSDLTATEQSLSTVSLIQQADIRPFSQEHWFGPKWSARKLDFNFNLSYMWSSTLHFDFAGQWQKREQNEAGILTTHITPDKTVSLPLDSYFLGGLTSVNDYQPYSTLLNEIESHGLWTNVNWNMSQQDSFSGGIRLQRNHGFEDDIAMEFMYTRQLNPKSVVTAKFSEGFRAPTFFELFSSELVSHGNTSLKSEKIQSFEASLQYTEQNWLANLTSFYQQQSNKIMLTNADNSNRQYFSNIQNKDMFGIEANATYQINQNFDLKTTLTHYLSDTYESALSSFATVSLLAKLNRFSFGLHTIVRSGVKIDATYTDGNIQTIFKQEPVVLVNAVANYQLGRSILLSLKVENGFDQAHNVYDASQGTNDYYVPQQNTLTTFAFQYDF